MQTLDSGGGSLLLSLPVLSYPSTKIRDPWFATLILLASHRMLPWSFSASHQRCRHQCHCHRICLCFQVPALDFCFETWQTWQILRATVSLPIATVVIWANKVDSVNSSSLLRIPQSIPVNLWFRLGNVRCPINGTLSRIQATWLTSPHAAQTHAVSSPNAAVVHTVTWVARPYRPRYFLECQPFRRPCLGRIRVVGFYLPGRSCRGAGCPLRKLPSPAWSRRHLPPVPLLGISSPAWLPPPSLLADRPSSSGGSLEAC